ncbi:MAG TPA: adenylate/guanylate cyclase domain-containing protein, partial [Gammaproteobacteria bacterium]|nr:adenylate/guanylate cyclase domain-containing protein [Gammaproteobacteria bacterium]
IVLLVTSTISLMTHFNVFHQLEGLSYDWRMSDIRKEKSISDDVVVILIDESSLEAMDNYAGRWPWPRYVYADLLDFLALAEPKGVMFDIMFTEKQLLEGDETTSLHENDYYLVDASSNYAFTYHATRFLLDKISDETIDQKSLASKKNEQALLDKPLPENFIAHFSLNKRTTAENPPPLTLTNLQTPSNNNYYLPFAELSAVTYGIGVVDVQADDDSVYRHGRLFHKYHDDYFPSLSTTAIFDNKHYQSITRKNKHIYLDNLAIPIDSEEKVLINYYGNYTTFSFSSLIASWQMIQDGQPENILVDWAELKDKYIFVGGSAAGLSDLKNTPMDPELPGVFIHASLASNILNNDFLTPADSRLTYAAIFLFALLTTLCVLFIKRVFIQNIVPIGSGVLFAYFGYYQFENNLVIDLVAPLSSLAAAWILSFTSMALMEGREKRKFKRMMGQYLSPAVLTTLADNQEDFAKAEVGSKENITILFSDIRSFTNISEKLSADKVVEMLNYYFSSMTDSIFAHEGTIDKFIGDAIMAFWGAPLISTNHADQATLSALDMIARLKAVNEWVTGKGLDPIGIGIGIHTGDAILGNIGSENKLDYTIIGDNVNLASRIEGLTKQYGVQILITEDTFNRLSIDIPCLIADVVRVKGKKLPIKVLQPLLLPDAVDENTLQTARQRVLKNDRAFQHYLDQEWDAAIHILNSLPDELIHRNIRQRCENYKKNPPDENWDGVFTMTTK